MTAARSRRPNTDSSAITGVSTAAVTVARPRTSWRSTGCSTNSTSRPASSIARMTAIAWSGVQPWLASTRIRASGAASRTARTRATSRGGIRADLELEDGEALGGPLGGGRRQLVGLARGDGHVGGYPLGAGRAAEERGQAHARPPGGQVVQRDVHRGLGAEVADDGVEQLGTQVGEVVHRAAADDVGQRPAQAGLGPGQRLARDPPDLRRLAVPAARRRRRPPRPRSSRGARCAATPSRTGCGGGP